MSYDENDRREIAARLRSKRPEEFVPRYERDVLEHIFHSLFPKQVYPVSNWVLRIPYTLAALIERQTCRDVGSGDYFVCSECGCEVLLVDDYQDPAITVCGGPEDPKYCPYCGAKVSDGD